MASWGRFISEIRMKNMKCPALRMSVGASMESFRVRDILPYANTGFVTAAKEL